jgi:hypothetical protein
LTKEIAMIGNRFSRDVYPTGRPAGRGRFAEGDFPPSPAAGAFLAASQLKKGMKVRIETQVGYLTGEVTSVDVGRVTTSFHVAFDYGDGRQYDLLNNADNVSIQYLGDS